MAMEFWGVEVKANETRKITVDNNHNTKVLHISQVALGEVNNEEKVENIPVRANIKDKKFVFGTLSSEYAPQITLDLVFEQDLELSHGWKDGSVYFCGYFADISPLTQDNYHPAANASPYDFSGSSEERYANIINSEGWPYGKRNTEELDVDSEDDDSEEEKEVVQKPAKKAKFEEIFEDREFY